MSTNLSLIPALEAVLFASGSPVAASRLGEIFGVCEEEIALAAENLKVSLEQSKRGIALICVDSAYQLCTLPVYADYVKRALDYKKSPPLSKAALEVLAVAAYNRPVTRSFIDAVRGVESSSIVASLCEKGLMAECGRLDAPGRPVLFDVTENFLRCFGLENLNQLPNVDMEESEQLTMEAAMGQAL